MRANIRTSRSSAGGLIDRTSRVAARAGSRARDYLYRFACLGSRSHSTAPVICNLAYGVAATSNREWSGAAKVSIPNMLAFGTRID
jgi:hypothetical protein